MMLKNRFDFDYDNSILAVSNSLLKYYNLPPYHATLPVLDEKLAHRHQNVILMILDGMGVDLLAKNLPTTSFIRQHITCSLFSVFPSTTTAATTAYHSGLSPWESGWIGWMNYFKQYDRFIENFRNIDFYTGELLQTPPPMETILKYETIYEKITRAHPEVKYHKVFPPFEKDGVASFAEMCDKIISLSQQNNQSKLFCAYWTEPDHAAHKFGTTAPEIKQILKDIDANLQRLYGNLQDSLLIVSADHGELDVEEIYLNNYPDLCATFIRPPALESRYLTFFVKEEAKAEFVAKFEEYFGNSFKLYDQQEFFASGLLGSGIKHKLIDEFVGDFVAIALDNKSLRYSTGQREYAPLKANHAGLSQEEMLVPLLVLEKE